MVLEYSKKVMENFLHPKNMGEIKNPDGIGKVGNPLCGDVMWMYIKIGKNKEGKEIIKDAKFKAFGCAAAIATSSVVTQLSKGKTLKEAENIETDKIVKSLGGLPPIKIHCSQMASKALKAAINDYKNKHGK